MILMAILGAGVGLGVTLIIYGLYPPRPSLAESLAALHRVPPVEPAVAEEPATGWASRLGRPAARFLDRQGLIATWVRRDLAILQREPAGYLAEKASATLIGLLLPLLLSGAAALAGRRFPLALIVGLAIVCAVVGFFIPDAALRSEATKRRVVFRHVLSCFLDLVVTSLAASTGVQASLNEAAETGHDWAWGLLRGALAEASITSTPPFQALAALGRRIGVPQLTELSASVQLAGAEGSKIRASLAAKAASLREHQLSDAEARAAAATERMAAPLVLTFVGFLTCLAYPAVTHILGGV